MSELRMPRRLRRTAGRLAAQHRHWYAQHARAEATAKRAAREVAPGETWIFAEHRSLAEIDAPPRDDAADVAA